MTTAELYSLPKDEIICTYNGILEKMTNIGYEELILRMKKLTEHTVPSSECAQGLKDGLLQSQDFDLQFNDGHLSKIDIYYTNGDTINAILTGTGLIVRTGMKKLVHVDGFEEFMQLTQCYVK